MYGTRKIREANPNPNPNPNPNLNPNPNPNRKIREAEKALAEMEETPNLNATRTPISEP